MGAGLAQHVPEQEHLQIGGGDLRFFNDGGDGDCFAGGGAIQRGLRGGNVKIRAGLLGHDGAGGGIVGGVFHFAMEPVMELLGGEVLRGEGLKGNGNRVAALAVRGDV